MIAFTARQFALNGLAHKVRPILAFVQHSLNARERPFREARLHILRPSFLPAHAIALRRIRNFCQISHMRYCPDKLYELYKSYQLSEQDKWTPQNSAQQSSH